METVHRECKDLTRVLFEKSNGNSLFFKTLLKNIYFERLLYFDKKSMKWMWNLSQIEMLPFSTDIIELITARFKRIPKDFQYIVQCASCIGLHFDIQTLCLLLDKTEVNNLFF